MTLNPYLSFNGNCEEAINFYKDSLNGEIISIQRYGDSPMSNDENKNLVLHSTLKFGDALLMASDSMDNKSHIGGNISISADYDNVPELETAFDKISAGGTVTMPVQDMFWGARFGMCKDKFGTLWMFNCDKK